MFNALRPDQVLVGLGTVLRDAADDERGAAAGFARGQLLSAFSVSRLLAAELRAAPDLLDATRADLLATLADDDRPALAGPRNAIAVARDGAALGHAVAALLDALDGDAPRRRQVHGALRRMIDAEVAALDRGPDEAGAR